MPARRADIALLLTVVTLLGLGTVMVYSASSVTALHTQGDSLYFLRRQLLWSLLGLAAMLFFVRVDYHHWRGWGGPLLLVSVALLVVVVFAGTGLERGATRWLAVGPINVQPSELAKLAIVLHLAAALTNKGEAALASFWQGIVPQLVLLGLVFGLIMLQPDLGTALAIAGTFVLMLFVGGARLAHLAATAAAALPVLAWLALGSEYRRQRLLAFLDPYEDPLGSGYHIIQSLHAIGSGGLFGMGLGAGRQKFFYLPEQHTDFIFAVLGEELGLVGGLLVIVLFTVFAWRGYRIALTAPDRYGTLLAVGVTTMVILQAIINLGVVMSVLPITGITLPLVSYGGSSLVPTLAGIGILLNISKQGAP